MQVSYSVSAGLLVLVAVLCVCGKKNALETVKDGDYSIVEKGTYRGRPVFLRDGGEYKSLVDQFRESIRKHTEVLPGIVNYYFTVYEHLDFKFKFVSLDEEDNVFILRYFARITDHPVFAGYQIQFVFDAGTKGIVKIYTAEVPLE
jgi:hypothetical protein